MCTEWHRTAHLNSRKVGERQRQSKKKKKKKAFPSEMVVVGTLSSPIWHPGPGTTPAQCWSHPSTCVQWPSMICSSEMTLRSTSSRSLPLRRPAPPVVVAPGGSPETHHHRRPDRPQLAPCCRCQPVLGVTLIEVMVAGAGGTTMPAFYIALVLVSALASSDPRPRLPHGKLSG